MKLQDKVALITGGTTGIGLAAARLFHAEGARVFVTGRSEAGIAEARKQLPPDVEVLPSDAASLDDVQALARTLKTRAGRIDVLFVNAGIARFLPIESVTPQLFDEQFDINVRGAYFTVQQILPLMSSGGSIVPSPLQPQISAFSRSQRRSHSTSQQKGSRAQRSAVQLPGSVGSGGVQSWPRSSSQVGSHASSQQ